MVLITIFFRDGGMEHHIPSFGAFTMMLEGSNCALVQTKHCVVSKLSSTSLPFKKNKGGVFFLRSCCVSASAIVFHSFFIHDFPVIRQIY